jgi:hypothetical protein
MYRLLVHCVDRVVAVTIRPLLAACQRRGGMMAVLAAGLLEAMDRERHQGGPIRVQQLAVSTKKFFFLFSLFFMVYEIQIFPRWVALMRGGRIWVIQSGHLLPPTGWRSSGKWRPRQPWR